MDTANAGALLPLARPNVRRFQGLFDEPADGFGTGGAVLLSGDPSVEGSKLIRHESEMNRSRVFSRPTS